jgi:hypothetical protein
LQIYFKNQHGPNELSELNCTRKTAAISCIRIILLCLDTKLKNLTGKTSGKEREGEISPTLLWFTISPTEDRLLNGKKIPNRYIIEIGLSYIITKTTGN